MIASTNAQSISGDWLISINQIPRNPDTPSAAPPLLYFANLGIASSPGCQPGVNPWIIDNIIIRLAIARHCIPRLSISANATSLADSDRQNPIN